MTDLQNDTKLITPSKAKEIIALGVDDWRDVLTSADNNETDFEADNYRFIADKEIDDVMVEELTSDEYILGCFNPDFLAAFLPFDPDTIKMMQEKEAYEALGKALIEMDVVHGPHGLQQEYARADGYGHYFAHYDGEEQEIHLNGEMYHVFRTN